MVKRNNPEKQLEKLMKTDFVAPVTKNSVAFVVPTI